MIINVTPNRGLVSGGTVIDVLLSSVSTNGNNFNCSFGNEKVPGEVIGNAIRCTVPSGTKGTVNLTIYYNDLLYSPSTIPFTYYGNALL